MVKRDIRKE